MKNTPLAKLHKDARTLPMVGLSFGLLTVQARASNRGKKVYWQCLCECGSSYEAEGHALRSGVTTHCGCNTSIRATAHTKHGMVGTRTYRVWKNMRRRCELATHPDYSNYGGRGITVCERWRTFENFYADMGSAPDGLTLERREVNGPYAKSNCRWATYTEQARNKRNTLMVPLRGRTISLAALAERVKIPYKTLWGRVHRGLTIKEAICAA